MMNRGDILRLRIDTLNSEGEGIAREEGGSFVVFVPGALPDRTMTPRSAAALSRVCSTDGVGVQWKSVSAPAPPVMSRTAWTGSVLRALTTCVAPLSRASSRRRSNMSTAITGYAPDSRAN